MNYTDDIIEVVDIKTGALDSTTGQVLLEAGGEFSEGETPEGFSSTPVFSQLGVTAIPSDVGANNLTTQTNAQGLLCRSLDDGVILGIRDTRVKITGVNPGEVKFHNVDSETPTAHIHLKTNGEIEISAGSNHNTKIIIDSIGRLTIQSDNNINVKTTGSTITIGDKDNNKPYLELNNIENTVELEATKINLGAGAVFGANLKGTPSASPYNGLLSTKVFVKA